MVTIEEYAHLLLTIIANKHKVFSAKSCTDTDKQKINSANMGIAETCAHNATSTDYF